MICPYDDTDATTKLTMNLIATERSTDAAGQSGQNNTVRTSPTRLSRMARYSASFAFFVAFVLPELVFCSAFGRRGVLDATHRCVKNATMVFAAFVAASRPDEYSRNS